ncbi:MAG: transporter [Actinomycetales bacterium]|nr:transporter [Actinomycetales bacterium]
MKYVHESLALLAAQPILLLALLLGVGSLLGSFRYKGVHLGPAAVLFTAIAVSSLGTAYEVKLQIPEVVGTLGLVLFTYTVGLLSGPNFFASLKRGWIAMVAVMGAFIAAAIAAVGIGKLLGLPMPVIAGSFAGALNNTPALAAASQRSGDTAGPTIGYSITYLFGVFALLFAALVALRKRTLEGGRPAPLTTLTVRVDRDDIVCSSELVDAYDGSVVFSRIQHGEENPVEVAAEHTLIRRDDLVTVVGPADVVDEVAEDLGHKSSHALQSARHDLDFRRITLSQPTLAGSTIAELDLDARFGAVATRVRRGDLDMVAQDDFVVQMGDRIRVTAPTEQMVAVGRYLGDSERGLSDINPIGFAIGLALGVALGLVYIPLPGGGFTLGSAAGTLLVGLVFGRVVRIGRVVVSMSNSSATSLSTFGMITFLAYAGSRAGEHFLASVTSDLGWKVFLLGVVITGAGAVLVLAAGKYVVKTSGSQLAGILAGAQTQPAVLAFANERSGFDVRVGLGYAMVYPAAMIAKILLAQVIAGL